MKDFKQGFLFGIGFMLAQLVFVLIIVTIILLAESYNSKKGRTILPWNYRYSALNQK